jgi:hypothetical protein
MIGIIHFVTDWLSDCERGSALCGGEGLWGTRSSLQKDGSVGDDRYRTLDEPTASVWKARGIAIDWLDMSRRTGNAAEIECSDAGRRPATAAISEQYGNMYWRPASAGSAHHTGN